MFSTAFISCLFKFTFFYNLKFEILWPEISLKWLMKGESCFKFFTQFRCSFARSWKVRPASIIHWTPQPLFFLWEDLIIRDGLLWRWREQCWSSQSWRPLIWLKSVTDFRTELVKLFTNRVFFSLLDISTILARQKENRKVYHLHSGAIIKKWIPKN